MKDFKTTLAGFLTFGLTVASFLVKNQDTKQTLQGLAGAVGSAGLMMAKDAGQTGGVPTVISQAIPPLTPVVPANVPAGVVPTGPSTVTTTTVETK